jgi:ubiquinone/menaquinone biosynthesis C-methylase UbiE
MSKYSSYCCTEPTCHHAPLIQSAEGLQCANGHLFPFAPDSNVPVFACESEGANEYSLTNAAEIHDNALRWVFATFETDEAGLRERLVARLGLKKGDKVLVTGAGAGNDLPYLVRALVGKGEIYAQDIAKEMLLSGVSRYQRELGNADIQLHFSASDATNLPFGDNFFDAAYHFGGINLFPDIAKGISEMNRVVKAGGNVVIGDEGIAPWLRDTEFGKMLVNNNKLYECTPPMSLLPATARSVELTWELSNCFYVIKFQVAEANLPINLDVPHLGKRGGSIRTRYFGQLEGIDTNLRDKIYAEAERRGISRVKYLESALLKSLDKNK